MSDPAEIERLRLKPKVLADLEGNIAIIQADGTCASFKDGMWHPGISLDSRDILDMASIEAPEKVAQLLADAAAALLKSAEEPQSES